MPVLKSIPRMVKRYIKKDKNNPYVIRIPDGGVNRFGKQDYLKDTIQAWTQPLGTKDLNRLPEGLQTKEWRFIAVLPPDQIDEGYQIEYKGKLFEVKMVQDWEQVIRGHMVRVK